MYCLCRRSAQRPPQEPQGHKGTDRPQAAQQQQRRRHWSVCPPVISPIPILTMSFPAPLGTGTASTASFSSSTLGSGSIGTSTLSTTAAPTGQSSQYSPIATLERQYQPPVGRRVTLIVRANAGCLVDGGVESVLKAGRGGGGGQQSMSMQASAVLGQEKRQDSGIDLLRFESGISLNSTPSAPSSGNGTTSDAFGDNNSTFAGSLSTGTGNNSGTSTPARGGGTGLKLSALSSKLARAARGAQDHIERGVTAVAIQAEKSKHKMVGGDGRVRPDVMAVGAFVRNMVTGEELCVGMTEEVEVPDAAASAGSNGGSGGGNGLSFSVPLVISPSIASSAPDVPVQLRLYIKSGATMLAGKGRRFVVGQGVIHLSQLQSIVAGATQASPSGGYCAGRCSVPMVGPALQAASSAAATAALELIVGADTKFPALCGIGWTLADPRVDTAYHGPLFNLPLEQPLIYPLPSSVTGGSNGGVLLTTERTTESAVVLPIAVACAKLFSDGASRSTGHASDVAQALRNNSLKFDDAMSAVEAGHAQCQLDVAYVLLGTPGTEKASQPPQPSTGRATVAASLQRPDSIFETDLGASSIPLYQYDPNLNYSTASALSVPFYPKVCAENDPRLLPGVVATRQQQQQIPSSGSNMYIGTVRIEIKEQALSSDASYQTDDPRVHAGLDARGVAGRTLEAFIPIDPIINASNGGAFVQVPLYDQATAAAVGTVVMSLNAQIGTASGAPKAPPVAAAGGLISLVGLDTLMEDMGCYPRIDFDEDFPAASMTILGGNAASQEQQTVLSRRRRLATLGDILTHPYMQHHVQSIRSTDANKLIEKHQNYKAALDGSVTSAAAAFEQPSHKRKDPRPFRPSSSRMDAPLAGIPFNVHIQAFSLVALQSSSPESSGVMASKPMALYHNITHGAPSDHARGFAGPANPTAAVPGARGGLRRLEAARFAAAQRVRDNQNDLIQSIATHFGQAAQRPVPPSLGGARRHVPAGHPQIARSRKRLVDSVHALHALTWDVAVRRASVFSQALGIALTSYLSHVGDAAKVVSSTSNGAGGGWPEIWKKHGFLITFEGLLSAAGKELGMIEDASVGIAMLRMVSLVFIPDGGTASAAQATRVAIPHSPYLRWLNLIPSGIGSATQYRLEIGIDQGYFDQRIPVTLRGGSAVRFYPILFQMGVDIRQWGANAAAGAKNQVTGGQNMQQLNRLTSGLVDDDDAVITSVSTADADEGNCCSDNGLLLDDEDDDVGDADNDVLIALNLEGLRKMNAYAHTITPSSGVPAFAQSWEDTMLAQQQQQQLPVHPTVAKLNEYIRSSAGKMEFGVLDEAATIAARLGGGASIFCKSGKDRTAMQVTHKQAQFLNRFVSGTLSSAGNDDARKIFGDATMMRKYGTRLPICEKNVGQAKFAFNALQSKFMPEPLKPPPSTLAGFLKGGKVFSREGGIES